MKTRTMKNTARPSIGLYARMAAAVAMLAAGWSWAGTITYYHNDLAGSPVAATNESGQVIWRESYRPYGERLTKSAASKPNTVWFTSRREDAETGLVYMGARYYDPITGRFVSTDPKGFDEASIHSHNRYAYGNNNPYRYIDPNGMWSTAIHHQIIDRAFSNWSSKERGYIKAGSDKIDAALNQLPGIGSSYQHAMRDQGQSVGDAEAKMWDFVAKKLADFRYYLYGANDERRAWEALGEALHPIMDSTSPSHEGFQIWKLTGGTPSRHGDFATSEEKSISPEAMQRTVERIHRVMRGDRKLDD